MWISSRTLARDVTALYDSDVVAREIPRLAVVTTHNRPAELDRIVRSLRHQVDVIIVVDNVSSPPVQRHDFKRITGECDMLVVIYYPHPPNLYEMWNTGLATAQAWAIATGELRYDVGVFNDDADVPPGWFDAVSHALRGEDVAAASSHIFGDRQDVQFHNVPGGSIVDRMCPWAFVVRGELELRADEDFRWWWGDTDFEWRCRQSGGVIIIPGFTVANTLANSTTVGALAEQAGRDRETFQQKWGGCPW